MSNVPPPPPPPPPPDPGYAEVPATSGPPRNGIGVAALVVGIIAFFLAFPLFPLGALLGIVAIILGFVGRGKAKRGEATNGGVATGGLVMGVLALLVAIIIGVFIGSFFARNADKIRNCAELPEAEQQECLNEQFGE